MEMDSPPVDPSLSTTGDVSAATNDRSEESGIDSDDKKKNDAGYVKMQTKSSSEDATTKPPQTPSSKQGVVLHRRRRRRRKNDAASNQERNVPTVDPAVIDKVLRESHLPTAYSFEIQKTIQRILQLSAKHVALQMPEGLLLYATVIADVLQRLCASATVPAGSSTSAASPSSSSTNNAVTPTTGEASGGDSGTATATTRVSTPADATSSTSDKGKSSILKVSVLGDVTYGACCIDDLGAQALGADLLVHYGHSCLVPLQHTVIPCLYVFVEIQIDIPHMVECLDTTLRGQQDKRNVKSDKESATAPTADAGETTGDSAAVTSTTPLMPHVYLLGTVQFRHALAPAVELLKQKDGYTDSRVSIPQVKPLSPGEVLGCTSPELRDHLDCNKKHEWVISKSTDGRKSPAAVVCFVADGRFHLESTMIANALAGIEFYRYDPYSKKLTSESYDYALMQKIRQDAIQRAKSMLYGRDIGVDSNSVLTVGIILGTLGRQGNPAIIKRIRQALRENSHFKRPVRTFVLLLSEITPSKLQMLQSKIRLWVQVACPRLSIDWGHCFSSSQQDKQVILLSPYEFFCCLEQHDNKVDKDGKNHESSYRPPMDFYSQAGGPWSNYYDSNKDRQF